MSNPVFVIDGYEFDVGVTSLTRTAEIRDLVKETALDGSIIRKVQGVYFTYDITLSPKQMSRDDYDALYEILTSPVETHYCKFPYAQEWYEGDFGIESVSDSLLKKIKENVWGDLSFSAYAVKKAVR